MTSTSSTRKRVLIVTYLFPPSGGVSVQRVRKFVKFLPEFGWDVTVLKAANPSVPLQDDSLLDEIPEQTVIRTARTYEPNYALKKMVAASADSDGLMDRLRSCLKGAARSIVNTLLQPDTAVLWYPQALQEGLRILREQHHDAIVVTAPPFSSLLVGAALARKTGVPLVLDYRDEWTINKTYFENRQQDRISNWLQLRMQQHVMRAAHTIVATSPGSARSLEMLARRAGSSALCTHIYNGFDPNDFSPPHVRLSRRDFGNGVDRLRIAFVGTLWKLTSIEPFVKAVRLLARQHPELLDRLEVVVAGRQVAAEQQHLESLTEFPCHVSNVGFLEHSEALRLMGTSDWLLQLLSDLPDVERVIASKLFEYMGAGRPILAISGRGDHWDIVSGLRNAICCHPDETQIIADALASILSSHRPTTSPSMPDEDVRRFERRELTLQIARLLDGVISNELTEFGTPLTRADRQVAEVRA